MNQWPLYSFGYSIPYIILLSVLLCLHYKYKDRKIPYNNKKILLNSGIIIIIIFFGLRGFINSDFRIYHLFFETLPNIQDITIYDFTFEPGFVLSSSLFKTIWPNYYGWVFFYTLFDIIVLSWFFRKYTDSILLAFVFFIAYRGLSMEFNLMRNTKAIMFFLLSIPYLQERKILPYMAMNILALSFHYTAVIYFPIYFFITKYWPKWIIWCIIFVSFFSFVLNIHFTSQIFESISSFSTDYIVGKLEHYEDKGESYGLSIGLLDRTFLVVLVAILYDKIIINPKMGPLFANSLILYYFFFMFFSDVQVISARMPTLLVFSYWVICTNLSNVKYKNIKMIFYLILLLSLVRVAMSTNDITSYYDNLLWGIHSYDERVQILRKFIE